MLADADTPSTNAELDFVPGIFIGSHHHGFTFHTLQRNSHLSPRLAKSFACDKILDAGSAMNEGKITSRTLSKLPQMKVPFSILVYSKDLFTALSTCRVLEEKSIPGDLDLLR